MWTKAHATTIEVYRLTRLFPREELYGLTSQIRRALRPLVQILPKAVAENSDGEMARFLHIARGSAVELEYHLLLARDLEFLPAASFGLLQREVDEIQRMLTRLINRIQGDRCSGRTAVFKVLEPGS